MGTEEKSETKLSAIMAARSQRPKKERTSQLPYAIIVLIGVIGFGYWLGFSSAKLALFWIFGIGFGFALQRSRFCFTAAMRDPWITGSTSVTRAALIAFGITSIGFIAIKYGSVVTKATVNLSMLNVNPIGLPLIIGGLMFGTGMVIAGGCASGTLMRVGEGFTMQLIAFAFFGIGALIGTDHASFWNTFNVGMPKIFLPNVFGWFGAIIVQGLIILLLYMAAAKWQKKKMGSVE